MSDQHFESERDETVKFWKPFLSTALMIVIALALIPFRREVAGAIVRIGAYLVWSLNLYGRVIPQQILWALLLILILYIAVGSFYGKSPEDGSIKDNASPVVGRVEAMARWIDEKHRGIYFKWQIANLLGKIQLTILQSDSRGTSSRASLSPPEVQAYLDAGVNTSYADYPSPGLFRRRMPTPLDSELEQVVDYLEEQMEIKNER